MTPTIQQLKDLQPTKQFFIGIDSDGCVFDTMEIKQKECFCPNFIKHFNLQAISKYARETWEFVNLYSQSRGCNRFLALIQTVELLSKRPEVIQRGVVLPKLEPLKQWINTESKLGNPTLIKYAQQANNQVINQILAWSLAVNKSIEEMVFGMPPFPFVRESLEKFGTVADLLVVSQTPYEALAREWEENKMEQHVRLIAGQELGTKTEHLSMGAVGKYPANNILMIGDAPGDLKAAQANGVLFYPINPGAEDQSWQQFFNEAASKFFNGTYKGDYENQLIAHFNKLLPAV